MNGSNNASSARIIFQQVLGIAVLITLTSVFSPASPAGKLITNNTPSYAGAAKNLGAEDPSRIIEVSIWLQLHNRSQFDALTQSLYDRSSPNYHHWLKAKDIAARFAPTADEAKVVQQFFAAHNLMVVK